MVKVKRIAKRTALVAVKLVEVFFRTYLYVFHPIIGVLVSLILAGLTKRTYYEYFDRIVGDFTDWFEIQSDKVDLLLNDKEF